MAAEPISDEEMLEICPNPPEEYTREQLKEEMEHVLGFLKAFVVGKSFYWQDNEEKRENLLIVAYYWADDKLRLWWKIRDNWNFAMSIVRCHTGEEGRRDD